MTIEELRKYADQIYPFRPNRKAIIAALDELVKLRAELQVAQERITDLQDRLDSTCERCQEKCRCKS